MTIPFKQSPNYHPGRYSKITHVVIHAMAGWYKSTIDRFMNKKYEVSAHYLISHTGEMIQMVKEQDTAYHVGKNANCFSIGIEHEDGGDQYGGYCVRAGHADWMKPAMWDASVKLTAGICRRWNIPTANIIGHNDPYLRKLGNNHADPGGFFDMVKYRQAVATELTRMKFLGTITNAGEHDG
jgi:N-acetylmuramoyl-L-alanine amidase